MTLLAGIMPRWSAAFRLLRVKDWAPHLGLAVLGYIFSGAVLLAVPHFLLLLLAASSYLASGYALNGIADRLVDGPEDNPLSAGQLANGTAWLFALMLVALGCAAAWSLRPSVMLAFVAGVLVNVFYSFQPLRLKRFFLPNLALNSAGFSIVFVMGALAAGADGGPLPLALSAYFFLFFLPYQFAHLCCHQQRDPVLSLPPRRLPFFVGMHTILVAWSIAVAQVWGSPAFAALSVLHSLGHLVCAFIFPLDAPRARPCELRHWLKIVGLAFGLAMTLFFGVGRALVLLKTAV